MSLVINAAVSNISVVHEVLNDSKYKIHLKFTLKM